MGADGGRLFDIPLQGQAKEGGAVPFCVRHRMPIQQK